MNTELGIQLSKELYMYLDDNNFQSGKRRSIVDDLYITFEEIRIQIIEISGNANEIKRNFKDKDEEALLM